MQFWLGQKFGTDEHYITRNIEKNREIYKQAYKNLRIYADQNLAIEDLREKYEDSKREIEKLKKNNKELRELAKVLKEHDVFRILEESGKWVPKKEDS